VLYQRTASQTRNPIFPSPDMNLNAEIQEAGEPTREVHLSNEIRPLVADGKIPATELSGRSVEDEATNHKVPIVHQERRNRIDARQR
jgi:hypothetical protein